MSIFKRRADVAERHSPLGVLGWDDVRLLDPQVSPQDMAAVQQIVEAAAANAESRVKSTLDRPDVDALLRMLIPGLMPLGGFPENPDEVAVDFVTGWFIADAEESVGLAREGMISKAAQMALTIRRPPADSEGFAPATWHFVDLGYCTNRLKLSPEDALTSVLDATE